MQRWQGPRVYHVLGAQLIVSVLKILNGSLKVAHILDGLPCPTGHEVFKPAATLHRITHSCTLLANCF